MRFRTFRRAPVSFLKDKLEKLSKRLIKNKSLKNIKERKKAK